MRQTRTEMGLSPGRSFMTCSPGQQLPMYCKAMTRAGPHLQPAMVQWLHRCIGMRRLCAVMFRKDSRQEHYFVRQACQL